MIRGLYTAASGMLSLQNRQETLSNNLANINTPGFKQDDGVIRSFPEQLLFRMNDNTDFNFEGMPQLPGQPAQIGKLSTGVYMAEAIPNFAQGDIEETDNQYDIALTDDLLTPADAPKMNGKGIQPKLFYQVAHLDNPAGAAEAGQIRYTRNGNWQLNKNGYLVTSDGYYVLDNNKMPIKAASDKMTIDSTGKVHFEGVAAADVDLGLSVVKDTTKLVREGNSAFRFGGNQTDVVSNDNPRGFANLTKVNDPATGAEKVRFALRQGWKERSNVDPTRTMTDMMTVLRAYEANQRMLTTLDGTLDKAVNEIGRVNG